MDRALVVMAKEPLAGRTKTRLSPPLDGQEAADLYRCLLMDTLDLMRQIASTQPIVAYLPAGAEPYFRRLAPSGFLFVEQVGADLGERLDHVTTACLNDGYRQVVVTDSDSPTLPAAYLRQAFIELDDPDTDVVFGPTDDGGYYLVGLKAPCPPLFREVTMSTATVLDETLALATEHGLRTTCLSPWYDVDHHRDLLRLSRDLDALPDHVAAHTRAFLSSGRGHLVRS